MRIPSAASLALVTLTLASPALAATQWYAEIHGTRSGQVHGDTARPSDRILVLSVRSPAHAPSPREPGRPAPAPAPATSAPICMLKVPSAVDAQLRAMQGSHEVLEPVVLLLTTTNGTGAETVVRTIKLQNAQILSIQHVKDLVKDGGAANDEVCFTYQKMVVTDANGQPPPAGWSLPSQHQG